MPTWNRTNTEYRSYMRRIEKRGHELRRKILLPLQHPPTEYFSPDDIKTRSRTSREQARSKIWPVFKSRLGLLAFFVFFFLQGGEILVSKIRDRRIDRGNKTLVRLRDAFRFYFETERNKRAKGGRQKKNSAIDSPRIGGGKVSGGLVRRP